jgi:hypothetical protein
VSPTHARHVVFEGNARTQAARLSSILDVNFD